MPKGKQPSPHSLRPKSTAGASLRRRNKACPEREQQLKELQATAERTRIRIGGKMHYVKRIKLPAPEQCTALHETRVTKEWRDRGL